MITVPPGQRCYHPDPGINAAIAAEAAESERLDLLAGFPPRSWLCPDCGTVHDRGHAGAIGVHRCLACGYTGPSGVMFRDASELGHWEP
jgi:rubredoxin